MTRGSRGPFTAALVVSTVTALTACTGGSGHAGHASITVDGVTATLSAVSCAEDGGSAQISAHEGDWTLSLRSGAAVTLLVVGHKSGAGVVTYQASADAAHPDGAPPTKITVSRDGRAYTGTAAVSRSGAAGTVDARFNIVCPAGD